MKTAKLSIFGLVLVGVVVFGFMFWGDLNFNKDEIADTNLEPAPYVNGQPTDNPAVTQERNEAAEAEAAKQAPLSSDDDYDDLEQDLNQTNTDVTSDDAQIQSGVSGL